MSRENVEQKNVKLVLDGYARFNARGRASQGLAEPRVRDRRLVSDADPIPLGVAGRQRQPPALGGECEPGCQAGTPSRLKRPVSGGQLLAAMAHVRAAANATQSA